MDQPPQIIEKQPLQFSAMMFESYDKSTGGLNDEDGQEKFVFPFDEEIIPSVDVSISVDMPRNFDGAKNFEVPKLHGVAKILKVEKNDGNAEDLEVVEKM